MYNGLRFRAFCIGVVGIGLFNSHVTQSAALAGCAIQGISCLDLGNVPHSFSGVFSHLEQAAGINSGVKQDLPIINSLLSKGTQSMLDANAQTSQANSNAGSALDAAKGTTAGNSVSEGNGGAQSTGSAGSAQAGYQNATASNTDAYKQYGSAGNMASTNLANETTAANLAASGVAQVPSATQSCASECGTSSSCVSSCQSTGNSLAQQGQGILSDIQNTAQTLAQQQAQAIAGQTAAQEAAAVTQAYANGAASVKQAASTIAPNGSSVAAAPVVASNSGAGVGASGLGADATLNSVPTSTVATKTTGATPNLSRDTAFDITPGSATLTIGGVPVAFSLTLPGNKNASPAPAADAGTAAANAAKKDYFGGSVNDSTGGEDASRALASFNPSAPQEAQPTAPRTLASAIAAMLGKKTDPYVAENKFDSRWTNKLTVEDTSNGKELTIFQRASQPYGYVTLAGEPKLDGDGLGKFLAAQESKRKLALANNPEKEAPEALSMQQN